MNKEKQARYMAVAHAVQSGVAHEMEWKKRHSGEPDGGESFKHLRVGVNTSKCEQYALAKLMVDKGIITWEEYEDAIIAALEQEKARYEELLSELIGGKVTLA